MRSIVQRVGAGLFVVAALSLDPRLAAAQTRPAPVLEIAAGAYLFPDDGETVTEGFVAGAARFYLTRRLSVGPEVTFVSGDNHSHWILTGNLTYDFLADAGGAPRSFTPFVVVGGGVWSTRGDFFDRGTYTSYEGAFTTGAGVRGRVGPRVQLGAEARVGWELHLRVNGFVGIGF